MSAPSECYCCPSVSCQMSPLPLQLNSWTPEISPVHSGPSPFVLCSVARVSELCGSCPSVLEKHPCRSLCTTHLFSKGLQRLLGNPRIKDLNTNWNNTSKSSQPHPLGSGWFKTSPWFLLPLGGFPSQELTVVLPDMPRWSWTPIEDPLDKIIFKTLVFIFFINFQHLFSLMSSFSTQDSGWWFSLHPHFHKTAKKSHWFSGCPVFSRKEWQIPCSSHVETELEVFSMLI